MRRNPRFLRGVICALVAAAFAVAAEPGAMAMPAAQPMTMSSPDLGTPTCDHMKPLKDHRAPCTGVAGCLGMLSCFGMAALAPEHPVLLKVVGHRPAHHLYVAAPGLTHPPENRPPIA